MVSSNSLYLALQILCQYLKDYVFKGDGIWRIIRNRIEDNGNRGIGKDTYIKILDI